MMPDIDHRHLQRAHRDDQLLALLLDVDGRIKHVRAMLAAMELEPDGVLERLHDLGVRRATGADIAAGRATVLVVGWPQDQEEPIRAETEVDGCAPELP